MADGQVVTWRSTAARRQWWSEATRRGGGQVRAIPPAAELRGGLFDLNPTRLSTVYQPTS